MKPHRIRMTHSLLLNYGLYSKMDMFQPPKATAADMTKFHSDDYIQFLRRVSPDNMEDMQKQLQRCAEKKKKNPDFPCELNVFDSQRGRGLPRLSRHVRVLPDLGRRLDRFVVLSWFVKIDFFVVARQPAHPS